MVGPTDAQKRQHTNWHKYLRSVHEVVLDE